MASNSRILVVDDQITNIETLKYRLTKEGFDVLSASRGDKAIEIALSELPDVVLLDIMMPEISGFEVCKNLTSNEKTRHIPIILVTALSSPEYVQKGFEVGAFDYVKKPFNNAELMMRIKSALISSTSNRLHSKLNTLTNSCEIYDKTNLEIARTAKQLKEDCEALKSKLENFLDEEVKELLEKICGNSEYIQKNTVNVTNQADQINSLRTILNRIKSLVSSGTDKIGLN